MFPSQPMRTLNHRSTADPAPAPFSQPSRRRWIGSALGIAGVAGGLGQFARTAQAATPARIASHRQVFVDPATEYQVTRWTEDSADAHLPTDPNRALSAGDSLLLYSSNRDGSWQPYLLDLKSGVSTQTSTVGDLRPHSLAMLRDGKDVVFLDGDAFMRNEIKRGKTRELYRPDGGWHCTGQLVLAHDDRTAALVQKKDGVTRVVFVDPASGKFRTVLQASMGDLLPLGFHQKYGLLLLDSQHKPSLVGSNNAPAMPDFPPGEVLQARWDRTGRVLMYLLHTKPEPGAKQSYERYQLMEYDLDQAAHRLIANTTKFATFSVNQDGSVFVGASSSVAQPLLLLLLRVTRREFSLMEHHSTIPSAVNPFFSTDSQTLYFESDRLGKSCVFSLSVKGLVEKT